jgi:hypothetical protein
MVSPFSQRKDEASDGNTCWGKGKYQKVEGFYTARSAGQKGCVNMPLLG